MDVTMGVDIGTSGARGVLVNDGGELVAEASASYPLLTPKPGWTEQRPQDWRRAALEVMGKLVRGHQDVHLLAIAFSGQMHGMVPLDEAGDVIRPALLWNDQRTGEQVKDLAAQVPNIVARTGNPAITGFQLPKVLWLRDNEPEHFARLRQVLFPKDYLSYLCTGERVAEPTDASGSNAFYIKENVWDAEVLDAVGLDAGLFPKVVGSSTPVGTLKAEIAQEIGVTGDIPVIAGAGDNAAASIGLGLSSADKDTGSLSLGTSGVVFAPLSEPQGDPQGRVHLFSHADGAYCLLGVTLAAAGSLQWYRDQFLPERSFDAIMALASESVPGANGVTFKPYLAGERTPHLNPDLRASWHGMSLATTQADIARSVIEGVTFSLKEAYDIIAAKAPVKKMIVTGGGAKSDMWLQMVADVLGVTLIKPVQAQGAAYGAALLAWEGLGKTNNAAKLADTRSDASFAARGGGAYEEAFARYRAL